MTAREKATDLTPSDAMIKAEIEAELAMANYDVNAYDRARKKIDRLKRKARQTQNID